jgi:N-acylneuraminate cytidylyltransferase
MIGIIPARGGSKGVPGKNIKEIAGFPLIYWSIQAAKNSKLHTEFYISTEDKEIARVAESYGAKVLWRPEELSKDDSTTISVLQNVVERVDCDAIVVLQPTSPLRDDDSIDKCITEYTNGNYDTLATGFYTKIQEYASHNNMRRQDIKGFFYDDGNIYIIDKDIIKQGRWSGDNICRYVLSEEYNYEIDTPLDFEILQFLLRKRVNEGKQSVDYSSIIKSIKLLVMDVDGVLTDAGMYYSENGDEQKKFNTRDGKGIELVRNIGIKTAIITSENTNIVARRAEKLKVDYLYQGAKDKLPLLMEILEKENIGLNNVAYIGDDINDLNVLKSVGFPVTPNDGVDENKEVALFVTKTNGGYGAVRELCNLIIDKK